MRKLRKILVISIITLGLMATGAFAADTIKSEGSSATQWASNVIGSTVKNLQGDTLGNITDLTIRDGRVTFAIVSHGGVMGVGDTLVLVPMNALSITDAKNVTIDITKDKFATAPKFEKSSADFSNRQLAEDTYKFYGLRPYWEESGMGRMMEKETPIQEQMKEKLE